MCETNFPVRSLVEKIVACVFLAAAGSCLAWHAFKDKSIAALGIAGVSVIIGLIGFFLNVILLLIGRKKYAILHWRNKANIFYWPTYWCFIIMVAIMFGAKLGAFKDPADSFQAPPSRSSESLAKTEPNAKPTELAGTLSSLDYSKLEWFGLVGWAIAAIGTIWAVWAKFMADKAFHSAQKAYQATTTKSRTFDELVAGGLLARHIEKATDQLTLLLGIPQVGYFHPGKKPSHLPWTRHALEIESIIIQKATQLASAGNVKILCFSAPFRQSICENAKKPSNSTKPQTKRSSKRKSRSTNNTIPEHLLTTFKEFGDIFDEAIKTLKKDVAARKQNNTFEYDSYSMFKAKEKGFEYFDPGLRIAIVGSSQAKLKKAIVWFVSDFGESPTHFESYGFETEDSPLIQLLEKLVAYYGGKLASEVDLSKINALINNTDTNAAEQTTAITMLVPTQIEADIPPKLILRGSMRELLSRNNVCNDENALYYLMMNLPYSCNYHCLKCCNVVNTTLHRKTIIVDSEILNDAMTAASTQGIRVMVIAGEGEPLHHAEFRKIVDYSHNCGLLPYIFTNGSLLDKDTCEFLADRQASLVISVDSLDKERYRQLTSNGDLTRVLENIARAREIYKRHHERRGDALIVSLAINTVVTNYNVSEIGDIREFCGTDIVFVCNSPTHVGAAANNWQGLYGPDANNTNIASLLNVFSVSHPPLGRTSDQKWCGYMKHGVSISADGRLLTCAYAIETADRYNVTFSNLDLLSQNKKVMSDVERFYATNGHSPCILRHQNYEQFLSFLKDGEKDAQLEETP